MIDENKLIYDIKKYVQEVYDKDLDDGSTFADNTKHSNFVEGLYEALEIIQEQPKQRINDKWIPVSIELPRDDVSASTYVTIKHKESGNVFTSRMRWFFGKFEWYNGKSISDIYEVTAWKYVNLPEPWKEASE